MAKSGKKEKEVVFASERYTRWQKFKKALIPFIVLVVVTMIVIISAIAVVTVRRSWNTGGEDTAYPYSWKVSGGALTVKLTSSKAENGSWTVTENSGDSQLDPQLAKKQREGFTTYKVTAGAEGRSELGFGLYIDHELAYEVRFLIETNDNNKDVFIPEVFNTDHSEMQTTVEGSSSTKYYSYSIGPAADAEGHLVILVTSKTGAYFGDWTLTSDNEAAVSASGIFNINASDLVGYDGEESQDHPFAHYIGAYIYNGQEAGTANIVFESETQAVKILCSIEHDENGGIKVLSHSMEGGESVSESLLLFYSEEYQNYLLEKYPELLTVTDEIEEIETEENGSQASEDEGSQTSEGEE